MSEKGINTVEYEDRKNDLSNIQVLFNEFGNPAYRAIEKYNTGIGYESGIERLTQLIKEKKFTKSRFMADPVKGIEEFLHGFFKDRGGNLPKVWSEKNTVFLMTEISVPCITIEAEKEAPIRHREICSVYCRAEVKGLIQIFEDFFPGIQIQFYNVSSRRSQEGDDCVEAFKVIVP